MSYIPKLLKDATFIFPSLPSSYPVKLSTSLSEYIQIPATSYWGDEVKILDEHGYIPELLEDAVFRIPVTPKIFYWESTFILRSQLQATGMTE